MRAVYLSNETMASRNAVEPKPGFEEGSRKVSPDFLTIMRHAADAIV